MININCIVNGIIDENCYIVNAEGREDAVLIDPGSSYDIIKAKLDGLGLSAAAVLVTHCHFDHIGAVASFKNDGAKVYMYDVNPLAMRYTVLHGKVCGADIKSFKQDANITDGMDIEEAGMTFRAIYTPGHSPTSFCFLIEDSIFTGDTLFKGSYGRTDLQDGSLADIYRSITERLFALKGDYKVYPGHDQATTLEAERKTNAINFISGDDVI